VKIVYPFSRDQLIEAMSRLSVAQAADLARGLEKRLGVSSSPIDGPVVPPPPPVVSARDTFDVELTASGGDRVRCIKVLREFLTLGLREARDFVDALPALLKRDLPLGEAEQIRARFAEVGATVTLK
jgi:large subunit ribosomal protein L7/L12